MSDSTTKPSTPDASMRWPVVLGVLAAIGFYTAINVGLINHPLITRYCASHPVEFIATTMFFVGLAALYLKRRRIKNQPELDGELLLGPVPEGGQLVSDCPALLQKLAEQPEEVHDSDAWCRLRDGLLFVHRRNSAEGVEDHLQHLADVEQDRSHTSYGLVRIIISTIPILGFLGTVIGITRAVAELAQVVGDMSFEQAINSVVAGLSVAFDTTALALALSIVLMFAMFFISRADTRHLLQVEATAAAELTGRFEVVAFHDDPNVLAIRGMTGEVLRSSEKLVDRQAEIWQRSLDSARDRWNTMAVTSERQMETALTRALQKTLEAHGKQLEVAEEAAEERVSRYWQEMLGMLDKHTTAVSNQYEELRRQGEIMTQAIEATGRIAKLEDALNSNLNALHESHHFDKAVTSLTAAIGLLNARLGAATEQPSNVDLKSRSNKGHAA